MKPGSSCDNFEEWRKDFEHKVTVAVIDMWASSIDCDSAAKETLHMTTSFILEECGISKQMLDVWRFLESEGPTDAS